MKLRLLDPVAKTGSAESVYAEKYQWLMRWALHFCGGDREMAEDLVQDTFVRMLSSWATIRDVERPERFLYTYLKYGFLRLRNTDRRQAFQSLDENFDLFDANTLSTGPELIERQVEIRTVVDFLCWRKSTAKSASLLLFRFFHGMFPSEIMLIARLSRKAVDDSLASSKLEARTYINQGSAPPTDAARKKPIRSPLPAEWTAQTAPSTEDLMRQILQVILSAGDGDCLTYAALSDRYSDTSKTPIDCWLLSHIVSCTRCLDIAVQLLGLPPRGSRPLDDVLGYAPKAGARWPRSTAAPMNAAMASVADAEERYRTAFEHKPKSILLIVNGERLASRDVSGSLNKLTVDLRTHEAAEVIEIASELSILLAVPILSLPPECAPVQQFEAELAGGRSVMLRIEFNPIGLRLHVTYRDPHFLESLLFDVRSSIALRAEEDVAAPAVGSLQPGLGGRIRDLLRQPFAPWFKFALSAAGACAIAVPVLIHLSKSRPAAVLSRALAAAAARPATGVQEQRVLIGTGGATVELTLHKDLTHRLHTAQSAMPRSEVNLEETLRPAYVEWSDPLSPVGFRDWRDQHRNLSSSSVSKNGVLLTLTTMVSAGAVREESLTLNAETLHPVGRTVRFSDDREFQIAELDYRIVPLADSDPAWFEEASSVPGPGKVVPAVPLRSLAREAAVQPATSGDLDVAELSVLLAFVELQADGQERLAIKRRNSDILVEGLVSDRDRKLQIEKRLRLIPHTTSSISSFASFEAVGSPYSAQSSLATSDSVAVASPLEALSAESHLDSDQVRALHASLLEAAVELRRNATELQKLTRRFPRGTISERAVSLHTVLARVYTGRLSKAAAMEQQGLQTLGVSAAPSSQSGDESVPELALANAQLCFEFISQQKEISRPAQSVLRDFAASVAALERASGPLEPPS